MSNQKHKAVEELSKEPESSNLIAKDEDQEKEALNNLSEMSEQSKQN